MTKILHYIFSREDLESPLKVDWISTSQQAWTTQMKEMGVEVATGLHSVGWLPIPDDAGDEKLLEIALVELEIVRSRFAQKFFPGQTLVVDRAGETLKIVVDRPEHADHGKIKLRLFQLDREAMEWKLAMTTHSSKEPFATRSNFDHMYRSWGFWEPGMTPHIKEGNGMG